MKKLPLLLFIILFAFCNKPATIDFLVKEINANEIIGTKGEIQKIPETDKSESFFFLVRHAEKGKGEDPSLTMDGVARADRLAQILDKRPLKQIFATNYNRTRFTAAPSAMDQGAAIGSYNPDTQEVMVKQLLAQGGGYNYLIVGHSNTVPSLLNLFAGKEVYKLIPEAEYDNLYMVIASELGNARILELKY